MDNIQKQLIAKLGEEFANIFPLQYVSNILDKATGETLTILLSRYNHIFIPFTGEKDITRAAVPPIMRRKGLYITYITPNSEIITEYFKGNKTEVNNEDWVKDENWGTNLTSDNFVSITLPDGSVTAEKLSQEVLDLIGQGFKGNIENHPDGEDLTSTELATVGNTKYKVLKFADRNYTQDGMGYVILRKNKTFAEQVTKSNTIYEIRYNFDLDDKTVYIPNNCVLSFVGGQLKNGTINFNNTFLTGIIKINSILKGTLVNTELNILDFGAKGDGITDDTNVIQNIINFNPKKIIFPINKTFFVSNLSITNSLKIEGNNSTLLFKTDNYATVNYHILLSSNVTNISWNSSSPRTSKIYINNPSSYKKGDIIKLYSDDVIEGTEFKNSQYFIVANTNNDYIEVTGKIIFDFNTNIKIQLIDNSKKLEINNLIISSLPHTYYNDRGLFTIIGGAYHNIKDCCIKNTNSHGFLFTGSYGYNVDNLELDYQDFVNTVPQSIGMGVADSASSHFTISFKGGYTQAFTCVYFNDNDYPETYGVSQFGNIKNSISSGSALDNHTNCYNLIYSDSIIASSENGIVVRGSKCIYDNISVNAAIYGLYVYGDAHNTGNSLDFVIRNTNIYSHTRCVQIENNKEYKIKGTVENCILEGRTAAIYLKNADIVFKNCIITGLITISNKVNVIFENCTIKGYINIAEGIIDSKVTISNSNIEATNHLYFRECPVTIDNTNITINGNYYILSTLATNLVFSNTTFSTSYSYLIRSQNSCRVELNNCVINHIGTNEEFYIFRTVGITIDVVLQVIFNDIYIYNKSTQNTKVYLSYVDSWKGGSSINNVVRAVYIDNNKVSELNICNRTDRIMVINDILDNPYYAERGNINTDGTLKNKEVIVYRVEDIVSGLTDTIYKIVKDINLEGNLKGIPANCTLDFQGGSFSNGTITFSNTYLKGKVKLSTVTLLGTCANKELNLNWFTDDISLDYSSNLQSLFTVAPKQSIVTIEVGKYLINNTVNLTKSLIIKGGGVKGYYNLVDTDYNSNLYTTEDINILNITSPHVIIDGINFIGASDTIDDQTGVRAGTNSLVKFNNAANSKIINCNFMYSHIGLEMISSGIAIIESNNFTLCNCGLRMFASGDSNIINNYFNTNAGRVELTESNISSLIGIGALLTASTGNTNIIGGKVEYCNKGFVIQNSMGVAITGVQFDWNRSGHIFYNASSFTEANSVLGHTITGCRFLGTPGDQHIYIRYWNTANLNVCGNSFTKNASDVSAIDTSTGDNEGPDYIFTVVQKQDSEEYRKNININFKGNTIFRVSNIVNAVIQSTTSGLAKLINLITDDNTLPSHANVFVRNNSMEIKTYSTTINGITVSLNKSGNVVSCRVYGTSTAAISNESIVPDTMNIASIVKALWQPGGSTVYTNLLQSNDTNKLLISVESGKSVDFMVTFFSINLK